MKHNYIGTEHLLLALIRGMDGQASKVLHKFGLNLENARQHVRQYLGPETPGGLGAERPRISHPQRKKKAEPKPDLEEVSEQLLQLVQSTIDDVAVGEKRDRLKELHADLERVIGQVRDKSRASEFEQLTKELLDGVGWYKDRAVAAGKTEMADRILELQKRVETVLEEIRNLIHPDPGESESKQL
jgi:ATP-dependent Clp protease ATP-binding subunit ClpA